MNGKLLTMFVLAVALCGHTHAQDATTSSSKAKGASTSVDSAEQSQWYIGAGGGLTFARATFASFAMDGTHPGFNFGVLGGRKINKFLSAEVSFDYTRMELGAYDCCQLLWLADDGNRYVAPLAGHNSYKFTDLLTTTSLMSFGVHLNVDLVSIWNENSKWSALVSPAIYGVLTSADIKLISNSQSFLDRSSFNFGAGVDLGVGYQINDRFGLRLTTGGNYLMGDGIDGLPKEEHKANYIWNTSIKLTFKL